MAFKTTHWRRARYWPHEKVQYIFGYSPQQPTTKHDCQECRSTRKYEFENSLKKRVGILVSKNIRPYCESGLLQESSPERALKARAAAKAAKELSASQQLEFDFFGGGNVSIAFQYQDAVTERLFQTAPTTAKAKEAAMILWTICRHLGWQSYECSKTATDLCEITRTKKQNMAPALDLLEKVGAIHRVKKGRIKIITVTPEGAFRGNVNTHAEAVERYRLDVIDGGKRDD